MFRFNIIIFLLFLAFDMTFAQSRKAYEEKAEETFTSGDYSGSLAYYNVLLGLDSFNSVFLYRAAYSAQMLDVFEEAEKHYETLLGQEGEEVDVNILFQLAGTKKGLAKYEEALLLYQRVAEHPEVSEEMREEAKVEAENCEWAIELISNPDSLSFHHYEEGINSIYSDFGVVFQNGSFYYTSVIKDDPEDDTSYIKISRYYPETAVNEEIIIRDSSGQIMRNAAYYVLNPDGTRVYFANCENVHTSKYHCTLGGFVETEGVRKPMDLTAVNSPGYTATQPSTGLLPDGREVLFFVSDRPEGKGGLDIWYTTLDEEGNFTEPENLAINTEEDDVTPFYHQSSNTLFFSTNGRRNLGGYDIYYTQLNSDGEWSEPVHGGHPLSGSYDDLYFSFDSDAARAFFTSNRPGCLCTEAQVNCKCEDIYSYPIEVNLEVYVFNRSDGSEFKGSNIQLIDALTGEVIQNIPESEDEDVMITGLDLNKEYYVVSTKEGWTSDTAKVSTKGIFKPATIEKSLFVEPAQRLEVYTFDAITKEPLSGVTVALIDGIRAIEIERTNPDSNDFYFEILPNRTYQISGYRKFYSEALSSLNTLDIMEPRVFRDSLYLIPFGDLPLVLYFDNDHPNPRTLDTNTNMTYGATFEDYYERKPVFTEEFTKTLNSPAKEEAARAIQEFFDNEIQKNYERLNGFCELLTEYLKLGNSFEIIIEGYASPIASSEYNRRLTSRRIKSVINHLEAFGQGELADFIREGRLKIKEVPYGEEKAAKDVSGDPGNRRMSVYSISASRERRVRIMDIRRFEELLSLLSGDEAGQPQLENTN